MKPFAALLSAITLAGALVACPSPAATPDFALSISPSALTLKAGASGAATLTVTPKNGFSATVDFNSSDAIVGSGPDKIALEVTSSGGYTGTMSIIVGANVPAKKYDLTIRAQAGSLSQSVALALTVTTGTTPPPPPPGAPANPTGFTATAGSSSAINLAWTAAANATGYSLERKSGAGAYAQIATPSSNGYLDASLTPATAYTYRLKAVNTSGSSAGVEASATTLAAPASGDFTLSVAPATLALAPGGSGNVTVTINRTGGFAGAVALTLEGDGVGPGASGIAGSFAPSPANGGSSTLTLTVGASVGAGSDVLTVRGVAGSLNKTAALALIVTAPKTVLLVDDDRSANNLSPSNPNAVPSASDTIFKAALDALAPTVGGYNVYVVPSSATGPSFDVLKDYTTVIWYTASEFGGAANVYTISSTDEINLKAFLDQGSRKAIIVSNSYIFGIGSTWTTTTNDFLRDYIGGVGAKADVLNRVSFTASGVAGTVTAGLSLSVANDDPITTYTDVVNPAAGTDTLITVPANPDNTTVRAVAAVTGKSSVGTASTSKVIYVGFALENIVDVNANSKRALLEKLLAY